MLQNTSLPLRNKPPPFPPPFSTQTHALAPIMFDLLTFSKQMVGLYKDPEGEDIFRSTPAASTLGTAKAETTFNNNDEVPGLRKRIRELEDEVKEIRDVSEAFVEHSRTNFAEVLKEINLYISSY